MTVAAAERPALPVHRYVVTTFGALLLRDVYVLRKTLGAFLGRTAMQPLMTVFVFTYVFPKIGQGVGGGEEAAAIFSTLLVPGTMGTACIFQGIQAVSLPLVQEFGFTREIEDRVLAPVPVWAVAAEKMASGAIQAMLAAAIVLPLAHFVPATPVHLHVRWELLLAVAPLALLVSAALGLTIGTRVAPQQVPLLFGLLVLPMTFLGATYYPWARLSPIPWLKWGVLVNPLVYVNEGLRAALAPQVGHMPLPAVFAGLLGFAIVLGWLGIAGFHRRVLT